MVCVFTTTIESMRITILSQWCDPEPVPKGLVFALALKRLGHDVEILTGFPNYPGGKLYPGYSLKLKQREIMEGVEVIRVPLFPSHDNSAFRRTLNYVSFMFSAIFIGSFLIRKPDVLYVYHPPATVGVAGSIISFVRRVPFVYDIQDLWPDSLAATGMLRSKWLLGATARVCKWIYRRADHIVVLSRGFKTKLVGDGVSPEKVTVIRNWCDESSISATDTGDGQKLPDGFNVVFAGNIGRAQGLDTVLEAAAILGDEQRGVNFVIVGDGIDVERLKAECQERQLQNVVFVPRVPMSEIGHILSAADVLLVHLRDEPLFRITIPSKTQAYLAIGRPILMAVNGCAADIIQEAKAGLVCHPGNAIDLADAVRQLAGMSPVERETLGRNGKDFYFRELSLQVGARAFEKVFAEVQRKRSSRVAA